MGTTAARSSWSPEVAVSDPSSSATKADVGEVDVARIVEILFRTDVSETRLNPNDMADKTEFADTGVDSFMSIAIIHALQRKTGVHTASIALSGVENGW